MYYIIQYVYRLNVTQRCAFCTWATPSPCAINTEDYSRPVFMKPNSRVVVGVATCFCCCLLSLFWLWFLLMLMLSPISPISPSAASERVTPERANTHRFAFASRRRRSRTILAAANGRTRSTQSNMHCLCVPTQFAFVAKRFAIRCAPIRPAEVAAATAAVSRDAHD